MRSFFYVLDENRQPQPASYLQGAMAFGLENRRVALTLVQTPAGEVQVSTVFLGSNLAPPRSTPEFFETMVSGPCDGPGTCRYETWDQALEGHKRIVGALQRRAEPSRP